MEVFKTYFRVLKKQWVSIVMYGVIFICITVFVSNLMLGSGGDTFENKKVPVHVVNEDGDSVFVKGLLNYLSDYVVYKDVKDEEKAREDALFYQLVDNLIVIPEGFTKAFLKGESVTIENVTRPGNSTGISVDNAINHYLQAARLYTEYLPDITLEELNHYLQQSQGVKTKVSYDEVEKEAWLSNREFNRFFYNYLGYVIVICFIIAISNGMLAFTEENIRRRHLAAPITAKRYHRQMIVANLLFGFAYLTVFFIIGFLFNPYRSFDLALVISWVNALIYGGTIISLSYFIGIVINSKKAIQGISTMLSLGMAFLTGMFMPQSFLPETMLRIGSFLPGYWYVKANDLLVYLKSYTFSDLSEILIAMLVQVGFILAFSSISLVVQKSKMQS